MEKQSSEAEILINTAIEIDKELDDHIAAVQHEQLRIQFLSGKPGASEERESILREFNSSISNSEALLKDNRSLKSQTVRGQMMQSVAQIYHFVGDYRTAAVT